MVFVFFMRSSFWRCYVLIAFQWSMIMKVGGDCDAGSYCPTSSFPMSAPPGVDHRAFGCARSDADLRRSGMSIRPRSASPPSAQSSELAEELALTTAKLSYLPERRVAFEDLATRASFGRRGGHTRANQANAVRLWVERARRGPENRNARRWEALLFPLTVP
jgi:tight adherence protein C